MGAPPGRILVTGAAGFIGSALVWALNGRGRDDIVAVDFPANESKRRNLAPLRFSEFISADVLRRELTRNAGALGPISTVFHLGACSSTTETDVAYLADNNTAYTAELAAWALSRGSRFIYASSAATYGDGGRGMDDKDDRLDRLRPLNAYGQSKHDFDLFARNKGWLRRIVGLKYFNVFGPNEDHKGDMRSVAHKACGQIMATGKVRLFKSYNPEYRDGEQRRDFLYVKDAVEMTLHFAENAREAAGLYNIGSGRAETWLTLARAVFSALDRPPQIEFIDMPAELREKYQYFTQADVTKLRSTGYSRPITPLDEAVGDYVRNYLVPGKRLGE